MVYSADEKETAKIGYDSDTHDHNLFIIFPTSGCLPLPRSGVQIQGERSFHLHSCPILKIFIERHFYLDGQHENYPQVCSESEPFHGLQ